MTRQQHNGVREQRGQEPTYGRGSNWTAGRALSAKGTGILLGLAIACGPVALIAAASHGPAVVASKSAPAAIALPAAEQAAGSYALSYVGAWLGATSTDTEALATYVDPAALTNLSQTPFEYRDLAVVSNEPAKDNLISVVIAANVKEVTQSEDGSSNESWPRRYFNVVIHLGKNGAMAAVGLPAPIAGPSRNTADANLIYTSSIPTTGAAATTVTEFLGAYLAGSGDITVFESPGSTIHAVKPAPFASVDPVDLRADNIPADDAPNGSKVKILVTVNLTNAAGQNITATYALTLTARANRWEVTSIDSTPASQPSANQPTARPTTSPTSDTTKGN